MPVKAWSLFLKGIIMDERLRELERQVESGFPGLGHIPSVDQSLLAQYVAHKRRSQGSVPYKETNKKLLPFHKGKLVPYLRSYRVGYKDVVPTEIEGITFQKNEVFFDAMKYIGKQSLQSPEELDMGRNWHPPHPVFESIDGTRYTMFGRNFKGVINYLYGGWLMGNFVYTRNGSVNTYGVKFIYPESAKRKAK